MPKIIWKGFIKSEDEFPQGDLPENAVKFNDPGSMSEMMLRAFPFAIPAFLICFLSMFLKIYFNDGIIVINPLFMIIGFVISFAGLLVHELLHAAVYPKKSVVEIGIILKSFSVFAFSTYPLTKKRFVLMSLLPIILGIVPLVLFIVSPAEYTNSNSILFMLTGMGLVSPYPDYFNVYNIILKQAP